MDSLSVVSTSSSAAATNAASTKTTAASVPAKLFAAELEKAHKGLGKGEKLAAVTGHAYGRIDGGKRDDSFVNLSGNTRSGQAFELIRRGDRVFHAYAATEKGGERTIVEVKHGAAADKTHSTADTTKKSVTGSSSGGAQAAS